MRNLSLTILLVHAFAAPAQQHMFSDEFDSNVLDVRWDTSNTNVNSHMSIEEGELHLRAVPLGGSDYWEETNFNAPRVIQPACGDWTVETRLRADLTGNWQSAALLVIPGEDTTPFSSHRWMEYRSSDPFPGSPRYFWLLDTTLLNFESDTVWMRLTKADSLYTGEVSMDGVAWISRTVAGPMDIHYLSLAALRQDYDGDQAPTEVYYDYFRVLDTDTLQITSTPASIGIEETVELTVDSIENGSYSWFGPNGELNNDSSTLVINSANVGDAGWYHVVVNRLDCQFHTDSFFLDIGTAIGEFDLKPALITIAPNPGKDLITISWSGRTSAHGELHLRDAMGRVVFSRSLNGEQRTTLNNVDLPSGAYFVEVRGEQWRSHGRFIKN